MKENRREKVTWVTEYIAIDGTVFDSKDECLKYEKNARTAIIGAVVNTFALNGEEYVYANDGYTALSQCAYDDGFYAIKIQNETELAIINRWLTEMMICSPLGADAIGKVHIFCCNEGDYYYYGTEEECRAEQARFMDDIVKTASKRFEVEEQEEENENNQSAD